MKDWRDAEKAEMDYCMIVARHELENPSPLGIGEIVVNCLAVNFLPPLMLGWMFCSGFVASFIGEGFPAYAIGSLIWPAAFWGFFTMFVGKPKPSTWDVYQKALKVRAELQLRRMRGKA